MLMSLAPYDAVDAMVDPRMSAETVAAMKDALGYNDPLWMQYIKWLQNLVTGNWGYSITTKAAVADQLAARIPNTIMLVLPAYLFAYVLAIVLGLVAGAHRGRRHRCPVVLVRDAAHLRLWLPAQMAPHSGHADHRRRFAARYRAALHHAVCDAHGGVFARQPALCP